MRSFSQRGRKIDFQSGGEEKWAKTSNELVVGGGGGREPRAGEHLRAVKGGKKKGDRNWPRRVPT